MPLRLRLVRVGQDQRVGHDDSLLCLPIMITIAVFVRRSGNPRPQKAVPLPEA
jgi:hypothetical protein